MSTLLDRVRDRIRSVLSGPAPAANLYWAAVTALAAGRDPAKPDGLAAAMADLKKDEQALLDDVAQFAELQAAEAALAAATDAAKRERSLRQQASAAEAEAARLRAEADRTAEQGRAAEHLANSLHAGAEQARHELEQARRRMAHRGHPASLAHITSVDAENQRQCAIGNTKASLADHRSQLAQCEAAFEEVQRVPREKRSPGAGDELEAAIGRHRAMIAKLEKRLAEQQGEPITEPAEASAQA